MILGIHNWVRWCDKVIDLAPADTGAKIRSENDLDGPNSRSGREML